MARTSNQRQNTNNRRNKELDNKELDRTVHAAMASDQEFCGPLTCLAARLVRLLRQQEVLVSDSQVQGAIARLRHGKKLNYRHRPDGWVSVAAR